MQVEPYVDTEKVRGIPRFGQHPTKNWIGDKFIHKISRSENMHACLLRLKIDV
jgi:hypothetical protein